MLLVKRCSTPQNILAALYAPQTPVGKLIQLAIARIQESAKGAQSSDYASKNRQWKSANPKHVLSTEKEQELLTSITDLIDRYAGKLDSIPIEEQELIDRLRTDFSSRTLHEILHRFLTCNAYDFSSVKSPLIHGNEGVLQLLFQSSVTQKLFNKEAENPAALMENQLKPGAIRRDEMMRLLISLKNERRQNKRQELLHGAQIHIHELEGYLNNALKLFELGLCQKRLQLQIVNEVHYTSLDIELSFQGAKAAVLDAALDDKRMSIVELLKKLPFTHIFLTDEDEDEEEDGSLQKDDSSCSFYSLYHLQKSSKRENFFADLQAMPHVVDDDGIVRRVRWRDFPNEFLIDAQTEPLDDSVQNQKIIRRIDKYAKKVQEYLTVASKESLLRIMTTSYNYPPIQ